MQSMFMSCLEKERKKEEAKGSDINVLDEMVLLNTLFRESSFCKCYLVQMNHSTCGFKYNYKSKRTRMLLHPKNEEEKVEVNFNV